MSFDMDINKNNKKNMGQGLIIGALVAFGIIIVISTLFSSVNANKVKPAENVMQWNHSTFKNVVKIFQTVNKNCIYMHDDVQYGVRDYWINCEATADIYPDGKGRGDCEDYSMAYFDRLVAKYPQYRKAMHFMVIQVDENTRHSVLFLDTTDGIKILDSASPNQMMIKRYSRFKEYYDQKIVGESAPTANRMGYRIINNWNPNNPFDTGTELQ